MQTALKTRISSPRKTNKAKLQRDPRREVLRKLGEKIRLVRHQRALTQEALADALGLSVAYVSLIERGGRNPPYTTVVALSLIHI